MNPPITPKHSPYYVKPECRKTAALYAAMGSGVTLLLCILLSIGYFAIKSNMARAKENGRIVYSSLLSCQEERNRERLECGQDKDRLTEALAAKICSK